MKPSGRGLVGLTGALTSADVDTSQAFHLVIYFKASLGSAMERSVAVMVSWRQANFRSEGKGQPGAEVI